MDTALSLEGAPTLGSGRATVASYLISSNGRSAHESQEHPDMFNPFRRSRSEKTASIQSPLTQSMRWQPYLSIPLPRVGKRADCKHHASHHAHASRTSAIRARSRSDCGVIWRSRKRDWDIDDRGDNTERSGGSASGISSRENMVCLRLFLDLRARATVRPMRCLEYGREVHILRNGQ